MLLREKIRSEIFQSLLSEISDHLASAALEVGISHRGSDAEKIFSGKKRIVVDFDHSGEPYDSIRKELEQKGYSVDFSSSKAFKTVSTKSGEKTREMSLDKVIKKEADISYKDYRKSGGDVLRLDDFLKNKDDQELKNLLGKAIGPLLSIFENEEKYSQIREKLKIKPGFGNWIKFIIKKIGLSDGVDRIEKTLGGRGFMDSVGLTYTNVKEAKHEMQKRVKLVEDGVYQHKLPKIFNAAKEFEKVGSGFKIVISRASIDVLRMSDWKHLQSCHSEPGKFKGEGGSYFDCAIEESKDGGLVVFLVKEKDIKDVDLEQEEVFSDQSRGISGIIPVARTRMRSIGYMQKSNSETRKILVPELSTYGVNLDSFVKNVTDWARDAQKDQIDFDEDGSPTGVKDAIDFQMIGGGYTDSNPSHLLNNLVGEEYKVKKPVDVQGMMEVVDEMLATSEVRLELYGVGNFKMVLDIELMGDPKKLFDHQIKTIKGFSSEFRTNYHVSADVEDKITISCSTIIEVSEKDQESDIFDRANAFLGFVEKVEDAAEELQDFIDQSIENNERTTPSKELFLDMWKRTNLLFNGVDVGDEIKISNLTIAKIAPVKKDAHKFKKMIVSYLNQSFLDLEIFNNVDKKDFTGFKFDVKENGEVVLVEAYVAYPGDENSVKNYIEALTSMEKASKDFFGKMGV